MAFSYSFMGTKAYLFPYNHCYHDRLFLKRKLALCLMRVQQTFYYIAELVRAEKEHSDWLPERSEFSFSDRSDGPHALQRTFEKKKCFNFDKKKQKTKPKCFKLSL